MVPSREYPAHPLVGVGAVVLTRDARVVLVRRGRPPLEGEWSLPGGLLDVGESLRDGLVREVREETGLAVEVGPLVETFEHVSRDAGGRVRYHYVILDYLCRAVSGDAVAASDASEIALADPADLSRFCLTDAAAAVIAKACGLAGLAVPARSSAPCR